MSKLKKVRCPNCKTVNTIDVEKELKEHWQPVMREASGRDTLIPRFISVTCSSCKKAFKVNV